MSQINIENRSYVTKAFARDLFGYANTNSIDHLIRSGKLSVFQSTVLGRKFLCLDEVKKLARLKGVSK
ncbi:MAG: hypothetical protein P8P49_10475 [Opitutales bacterium]|nr:hypothetical protein [Opitutales bacterium]